MGRSKKGVKKEDTPAPPGRKPKIRGFQATFLHASMPEYDTIRQRNEGKGDQEASTKFFKLKTTDVLARYGWEDTFRDLKEDVDVEADEERLRAVKEEQLNASAVAARLAELGGDPTEEEAAQLRRDGQAKLVYAVCSAHCTH